METLVMKLQADLQSKLDLIDPDTSPVKGYDKKIKVVRDAVLRLKEELTLHPLPDKSMEIQFFKEWLPSIYKQYVLFGCLYKLEFNRIMQSNEMFAAYLESETIRITDFMRDHQDLYFYYILGETNRDEQYFVRMGLSDGSELLRYDTHFCEASLILSQMLANVAYKTALDAESRSEEKPLVNEGITLDWAGTKAEAVEFIAAAASIGLYKCNGQPATAEQIKRWMEEKQGIDLKGLPLSTITTATVRKRLLLSWIK